eukprot:6200460-Pleurochrysis_carterae.AAC.2
MLLALYAGSRLHAPYVCRRRCAPRFAPKWICSATRRERRWRSLWRSAGPTVPARVCPRSRRRARPRPGRPSRAHQQRRAAAALLILTRPLSCAVCQTHAGLGSRCESTRYHSIICVVLLLCFGLVTFSSLINKDAYLSNYTKA